MDFKIRTVELEGKTFKLQIVRSIVVGFLWLSTNLTYSGIQLVCVATIFHTYLHTHEL